MKIVTFVSSYSLFPVPYSLFPVTSSLLRVPLPQRQFLTPAYLHYHIY
ncbi:MAG: hypothetical protein ACKO9R_10245 [Dolichospermum sp.]